MIMRCFTPALWAVAVSFWSCIGLAINPAIGQGIPYSVLSLTNPTAVNSGSFGYSVAAVGADKVIIGAATDNTGAPASGVACLFSANGALLKIFTNPIPGFADYFGNSVAAVGGDKVVIGAWLDNRGANDSGAAYLFSTNGSLLTTFSKPSPAAADFFGVAVAAVSTDQVLIGCLYDDTAGADAGAAYLFSTNGTLLKTFLSPAPTYQDYFGWAVAALGTSRVIIGAYQDNTGSTAAGAAYLFSTNGTLLTTFTNPTPATADNFGISVAAVGADKILIGAYHDSAGASNAGAAYLFNTNGTLLTTFTNRTPIADENFGVSVAAMGTNKVLIGANYNNSGATNAGAVYLFSTNGTLLQTFVNPAPTAGANFGGAVAAAGADRLLVGALNETVGGNLAGAAFLLTLGYPNLDIAGGGTNYSVKWITPEPGLILQQTDTMTTSTAWIDTIGAPLVSGFTNIFNLTVPSAVNNRFYKLRRP